LFNWFILVFFFLTATGWFFWMPSSVRSPAYGLDGGTHGTGEKQRSKEQYSERHNDFSAFQEPQDSDLEEVERQVS
jgi:hypothetical protein